jgi:Tfp pilus assembly protein PilF
LSDAAACIERGDDAGAMAILTRHLTAHPEHVTVRAYLAEIHFRRGEWQAARSEFDRFVEEAQIVELELPRQIHGHTRLMTIAEKLTDKYSEHLHRGIGLYLLSRQTTGPNAGVAERYLCAAAGELARAERIHPDRARSHWYRYRVWQALGQVTAARTALRAAVRDAAFSDLTLAEKLDVSIARDVELRSDR